MFSTRRTSSSHPVSLVFLMWLVSIRYWVKFIFVIQENVWWQWLLSVIFFSTFFPNDFRTRGNCFLDPLPFFSENVSGGIFFFKRVGNLRLHPRSNLSVLWFLLWVNIPFIFFFLWFPSIELLLSFFIFSPFSAELFFLFELATQTCSIPLFIFRIESIYRFLLRTFLGLQSWLLLSIFCLWNFKFLSAHLLFYNPCTCNTCNTYSLVFTPLYV